jgi:hypothetical protein
MKLTRWLSIVLVVAALLAAPGVSLAQNFPSQQGGGGGQGQGGFPSQGGQQPAQSGFYQSTDFGFSLTFGPPWSLVEQVGGPGAGFEGVVVTNGTSVVTFMGVTDSNTPQTIVQNVADNLGVPMEFLEVAADEPDVAAAYYISSDGQMGARIFAAKMDPSTAFLLIWLFPAAQYETESEAYNLLLDGLQFGG